VEGIVRLKGKSDWSEKARSGRISQTGREDSIGKSQIGEEKMRLGKKSKRGGEKQEPLEGFCAAR
jgi:hypothetical protein